MAKHRKQQSPPDLIVGRKPIKEAFELKTPAIDKVLINSNAGGPEIEAIRRLAASEKVPVQFVPEARLNRLCPQTNHQGVAAFVAPVEFLDVDTLLQQVAPTRDDVDAKKPILLVLDGIEDPHNFGAILRTALAAGVAGVIVPTKHMAPINEATIKASAGAALRIAIARVSNLKETMYQLKERGYWVVGTAADGAFTHQSYDWDRPVAIVMGSEGRGIHHSIQTQCDAMVSIPLYGPMESLNVSVAAALVMYGAAGSPWRNQTREEG